MLGSMRTGWPAARPLGIALIGAALASCTSAGTGVATPPSVTPAPLGAAARATTVASGEAVSATLVIRNNHDIAYRGAVEIPHDVPESRGQPPVVRQVVPDGRYTGAAGDAQVVDGTIRAFVDLPAHGEARLTRDSARSATSSSSSPIGDGPLGVSVGSDALELRWGNATAAKIDLALAVIPGNTATVDSAVAHFAPLAIDWRRDAAGALRGSATSGGYAIALAATPYAGGVDATARITRLDSSSAPAYLALVRRVVTSEARDAKLRFNGRVFPTASSPDLWDRDFWYTRGVDWLSWRSGALSFVGTSRFTPGPTMLRNGAWREGSHFYVWERTRASDSAMYMVAEIAGPNPEQAKSKSMAVTQYAPLAWGDTVRLGWRLGISDHPTPDWEESQLRGFAGYVHAVAASNDSEVVDIGVRGVSFGTSYLPYSTFAENFDYYRTPGLDRETFWPFSPVLWTKWRDFKPRMETDLHIIRAMGFDWVRLHHIELLQGMDRAEALAFLDWYTAEARALGLKVLIDSEGPTEWVAMLVGRYPDVVKRLEIENEVLIPGITPGEPERWKSIYAAAKSAGAPDLQAFFTAAGNNGMFERLRALGVPFDRVGLHAYKHGPQWKEALGSHTLGTGGYATSIGREATLGEFNWKNLTELAPEVRRAEVDTIYRTALAARAIPEVFEFHFQETLDVNPSIGRSGVRHYEPLFLDRRLKPEGRVLATLIRQYAAPESPFAALELSAAEATFANDRAEATMRLTNHTAHALTVRLEPEAFDGTRATLTLNLTAGMAKVTIAPNATREVPVVLTLPANAAPGTYHWFVKASFDAGTVWGWGVAANPGTPTFGAPVLGDAVSYTPSAGLVGAIDFSRPLGVAFGGKMPILEMEMAYALANTLQAATGRPVWLSRAEDVPDSLLKNGTLFVVGTPATNPLVAAALGTAKAASVSNGAARHGLVIAGSGAHPHWVVLTGADKGAVEAATTEFMLRYWPNAKDAAIRVTGMERGAALGNKAGVTTVDPP